MSELQVRVRVYRDGAWTEWRTVTVPEGGSWEPVISDAERMQVEPLPPLGSCRCGRTATHTIVPYVPPGEESQHPPIPYCARCIGRVVWHDAAAVPRCVTCQSRVVLG